MDPSLDRHDFNDSYGWSNDDYRKWVSIASEFTRSQLIATMEEYRGLSNPAYRACHEVLERRSRQEHDARMRGEEIRAWAGMSEAKIRQRAKREGRSAVFVGKVMRAKGV